MSYTKLRFTNRAFTVLLAGLLVLIGSCSSDTTPVLEREARFELGIGHLEDEIGLFSRNGVIPNIPNTVTMRNGMIYIGNGSSNKIMGFTSYGDLVRLVYRRRNNPQPVTLGTGSSEVDDVLVTRRAVPFSFNQLGLVTVDSRRFLYAEDRLPANRAVWDDDLEVMLNRVILRFDTEGNPIDYIGQEGVGGSPFPHITRMTTNSRDELVVITTTQSRHFVHFYTSAGDPLTTVEIGRDRLPVPALDSGYIPVLDDVIAGVNTRRVFVKVSYYRALKDPASDKEQGIGFDHSRVYWINLHDGKYEGYIELPRDTGVDRKEEHFELVGVARDGHFFLLSREDEAGIQLVIMNDQGRVLRRRSLQIPERDLVSRSFYLDHDGVLTALLVYPDRAVVAWWRSDRLLPTR